jgi:hypothetical protein
MLATTGYKLRSLRAMLHRSVQKQVVGGGKSAAKKICDVSYACF